MKDFKILIHSDNPDVDIKGANLFKEHLYDIDKLKIKSTQKSNTTIESKVESILVCTGVYNPQNDLNFHLEKLFSETNQEARLLFFLFVAFIFFNFIL
jgi:hypothetical protein